MLIADRLTLHLHDDTTTDLPPGTLYEHDAGGGRYRNAGQCSGL